MIITIDGPAGSGKSSVAEQLSKRLNFLHFNSGSLYRAVTAFLLENKFDIDSMDSSSPLPNISFQVKYENGVQRVFVNQKEYTHKLRDNTISVLTPKVSSNKNIRKAVDDFQKKFTSKHDYVIDGRDIGSFVFPNADYKFYLDCDIDERTKRRLSEERIKNPNITFDEIKKQIIKRDEFDKNKKIAPLIVPKNAIIIDSTALSIDQVVNKMLQYINVKP